LCGGDELVYVLDLGFQPLANSLLAFEDEAETLYPLSMVRCSHCQVVQLGGTVDPTLLFCNYLWVTGTAQQTLDHCAKLAQLAMSLCASKSPRVLEVASNDGTLLSEFLKRGCAVLGVDPAENLATKANSEGIRTLPVFFNTETAHQILSDEGIFDIVIARNVLSHVGDPGEIFRGVANLLGKSGSFMVEFHRADVIMSELHYDSTYHEHTFFHSLHTICSVAERFDFVPVHIVESRISGGSWVVFFGQRSSGASISHAVEMELAHEKDVGVTDLKPWLSFGARAVQHAAQLRHLLEEEVSSGKRVAVFGASARSSTLLNASRLNSKTIEFVVDSNPLKQGRFTAGTRLPIFNPVTLKLRPIDTILVTAFNFQDEIISLLSNELNWSGQVIVPLPSEISQKSI
jgi:SAM-dependent methyltransferase